MAVTLTYGQTRPTNPTTETLWFNTSLTPHRLQVWNGTAFVDVTPVPSPGDTGALQLISEGALAAALRITTGETPTEPQLGIVRRVGGVGEALVALYGATAPLAIRQEAVIRVAGYLYDSPTAPGTDRFAAAWHNSGAASVLGPWIERRADSGAAAPASTGGGGSGSGDGLSTTQVTALVQQLVADWAEAANSDRIPASKLAMPATTTEAAGGTSTTIRSWTAALIRAAINAVVPAWARTGNTDAIPAAKLSNAPAGLSTSQTDAIAVVDGLLAGTSHTRTTKATDTSGTGEIVVSNGNTPKFGVPDAFIVDIDSDGTAFNAVRPGQLVDYRVGTTSRIVGIVRGSEIESNGLNRLFWFEILYKRGVNQYLQPAYNQTATITFGADIDDVANSIAELRTTLPFGNVVTDGNLSSGTEVLLKTFGFTTLGEMVEWHDEHHTGVHTITGLTYNTSSAVTDPGDINVSGGLVTINPANDAMKASIKAKIVQGRMATVRLSASIYVTGFCNSGVSELFGKLNFNLSTALVGGSPAQWVGTPTNNHAVTMPIESNIPARSELAAVAFSGAYADLTGKPSPSGVTDDDVLDLAKATRVTGDRGKALGASLTNQDELALLPVLAAPQTGLNANVDTTTNYEFVDTSWDIPDGASWLIVFNNMLGRPQAGSWVNVADLLALGSVSVGDSAGTSLTKSVQLLSPVSSGSVVLSRIAHDGSRGLLYADDNAAKDPTPLKVYYI